VLDTWMDLESWFMSVLLLCIISYTTILMCLCVMYCNIAIN